MKWIQGLQAVTALLLLAGEGYAGNEGDYNANVYYGVGAGMSLPQYESLSAGRFNVLVGYGAGYHFYGGDYNVFYGAQSAFTLTEGKENVIIGAGSAYNLQKGSGNVLVGTESGYTATDLNGSIFIGYHAGYSVTRNNTLYIANRDTDIPLIYGEFDTGLVKFSGNLEVKGETNSTLGGDVTFKQSVTIEGDANSTDLLQSDTATIHDMIGVFMVEKENPYASKTLLTLEQNNQDGSYPSDVAIALKNSKKNFQWNIQTLQNDRGLSFSKIGSGKVEMTLTPADGPNGLQILMGDGGKYSNGQWLDASSRTYKENIQTLNEEEALAAFEQLQPVHYNYKTNKNEPIVGFIAEDVPDLVAPRDHKSLSALEMTALLAKVVQVQEEDLQVREQKIEKLQNRQQKLRKSLNELKELLNQSDLLRH